jgi:subtilisin-like proprotein convertase family protein
MKDFLDQELAIGEPIIACVPHGRNSGASLVKGEVIGFTKTMVRVRIPFYNLKMTEERLISPSKVILHRENGKTYF